jgi:hypothetical protein
MCVNVAIETRFLQTSIHGRFDTKPISFRSTFESARCVSCHHVCFKYKHATRHEPKRISCYISLVDRK